VAITPEQVKNQEFPIRLKGYDPDLVRHFLADVAQAYRATIRDQGAQWALANISDDMAAVLRAAHDAADKVVALAEQEAAEVRLKAEAEAESILADADGYSTKVREDADTEAHRALAVLKRAQGEATTVTRDAGAARELLEAAQEQADKLLADARAEAAQLRAGEGDVVAATRNAAEADELHLLAEQRYEEAQQSAAALLHEAEARAAQVRQEADALVAERRREASEDREQARILLERTQAQADLVRREAEEQAAAVCRLAEREARSRVQKLQEQAAEIHRAAESEARDRVQAILSEAQRRLDALEVTEQQLHERIFAAQQEFQGVVQKLLGDPNATIDLTDDHPMVVLGGRMEEGDLGDSLEVFVEELHTDAPTPRYGGSRVDPGTVQRMVSAAVDRALEHSRT
jgi:DivIVA domain-containing protein